MRWNQPRWIQHRQKDSVLLAPGAVKPINVPAWSMRTVDGGASRRRRRDIGDWGWRGPPEPALSAVMADVPFTSSISPTTRLCSVGGSRQRVARDPQHHRALLDVDGLAVDEDVAVAILLIDVAVHSVLALQVALAVGDRHLKAEAVGVAPVQGAVVAEVL